MQLLGRPAVRRRLFGSLMAALIIGMIGTVYAQAASTHITAGGMSFIPANVLCASLSSVDLSKLDTVIISASDATEGGHVSCDVRGYISPQTQFEVLLPESSWRGDYLQQGCGGYCGSIHLNLTDPARTSGYQAPFAPLTNGELVVLSDGGPGPGG